jgi:hypothetical protein
MSEANNTKKLDLDRCDIERVPADTLPGGYRCSSEHNVIAAAKRAETP